MTPMEHFRRSPRWLVLLVVFAALAVTTAALLPHDDVEERSCLVCKASQQATTELIALMDFAPPLAAVSFALVYTSSPASLPDVESSPPRAPPA